MYTAIYSTTPPHNNWTKVAQKLYEQQDIKPIYWVNRNFKNKIKDAFPNILIHDATEAIRGRFPDKYEYTSNICLDENTIQEYSQYESIVLKMMDRLDIGNITGNCFSHADRVEYYHKQLAQWLYIVEDLNPDVVIFGATPHGIYDYVLYTICEQKNIETIIFTHTSLPNRFLTRNKIHQNPIESEEICSDNNVSISKETRKYIEKISGEYEKAEPGYMQKESRTLINIMYDIPSIFSSIRNIIRETASINDKRTRIVVKKKGKSLEESVFKDWEWKAHKIKSNAYKYKLKKKYEDKDTRPNYSDKYIYFPLHYQPERTTSPEGGQYVRQYLIVNLLSSLVSDDTQIYVKEHPSQFSSRLNGERGRKPKNYRDFTNINNVKLITLSADQFDLIDNSKFVVTVTGTAGWEAILRGTPTIVFGNAWYRSSPGCYYVKTRSELENAIDDIIFRNFQIPSEEVENFISSVESQGYYGTLNSNREDNGKSLYNAICDKCKLI